MTDKEVYEKFMMWMGMKLSNIKITEKYIVVKYKDSFCSDIRWTTKGYDEFYSGAIFDKHGNIIKGYIDSHVMSVSKNCVDINKIFKCQKEDNRHYFTESNANKDG